MSDQVSGDSPSDNSMGEPLPEAQVTPPTPQQDRVRDPAGSRSQGEEKETIKLEKDIRSGERWLIGINGCAVILSIVIALIYYGQLLEMRKSTDAATRASNTAAQNLKDSESSFAETLCQMQAQTLAQPKAASAAKDAADISKESLVSIQRAFIFFSHLETNNIGNAVEFVIMFENSGTTPTKIMRTHVSYQFWTDDIPKHYSFPDLWATGVPHITR